MGTKCQSVELVSLYRNHELVIDPAFQRLFRWDEGRKTSFVESLLLGIPTPPIFVFQNDDGTWELVDGLQRTSTILEFMGELQDSNGQLKEPSVLMSTKLLPSLEGVMWHATSKPCLTPAQKLDLRRARLRVEILKRESNDTAKYELFQRLNTGGAPLSEQEVRNCTLVMINPVLYKWLQDLSEYPPFVNTTSMTDTAISRQADIELVLRFFAFLEVPYIKGFDVHKYLSNAAITIAMNEKFDLDMQQIVFSSTFDIIHKALGEDSFRRWDGNSFSGKFLHSVFEVVAIGIARNLDQHTDLDNEEMKKLIVQRSQELWSNETFKRYSGAGVRGTDRLANLLPMAKDFM